MKPKSFLQWRVFIPNIITIGAMLSGFACIIQTIQGMLSMEIQYYSNAGVLIFVALMLDGIDGNVARWLKGQSDFGAELDTFVDFTAFGIAPAIMVYATTLVDADIAVRSIVPAVIVIIGASRLARFRAMDPERGLKGYTGLPITLNASFVALFVILMYVPENKFTLQTEILFIVGTLILTILQISNVRYPAPTKKASTFIPCILVVLILCMLHLYLPAYTKMWVVVMLLIGFGYVIVTPIVIKFLKS